MIDLFPKKLSLDNEEMKSDIESRLNRSTSVTAADTNYETYMVRGEALFPAQQTPTVNGQIAWRYV